MAYSANPNLFVESLSGGLRAGSALTDLLRRKRDDRELTRLAQLAKQGQYEDLGAGLIGMGEVGPGIAATNVPYNRRQQELEIGRQEEDRRFKNSILAANLAIDQAKLSQPDYDIIDDLGIAVDKRDPTKIINIGGGGGVGDAPMFPGKSVQATALNWLVENQKITSEEAATVAAGKVVQYSDGSSMFMTPQGLVRQSPDGATVPVGGTVPQGAATAPAPGFDPNRFIPAPPAAGTDVTAVQPQTSIPRGVPLSPPRPKEMTEGQGKAAGFADRVFDALPTFEDPTVLAAALDLKMKYKAGAPLVGNYLTSPAYKQFDQAARNFINAVLRRESGAVISDSEFENANKQYLPVPGDDETVLAQKKQNRERVLASLQREAGALYKGPGGGSTVNRTSNGLEFEVKN